MTPDPKNDLSQARAEIRAVVWRWAVRLAWAWVKHQASWYVVPWLARIPWARLQPWIVRLHNARLELMTAYYAVRAQRKTWDGTGDQGGN